MNQRLIFKQKQNIVNKTFHIRKNKNLRNSYSDFQEEIKYTTDNMSDSVWRMKFLEDGSYPPIKLN